MVFGSYIHVHVANCSQVIITCVQNHCHYVQSCIFFKYVFFWGGGGGEGDPKAVYTCTYMYNDTVMYRHVFCLQRQLMDPVALQGETRPPKFMICHYCGAKGHRASLCPTKGTCMCMYMYVYVYVHGINTNMCVVCMVC